MPEVADAPDEEGLPPIEGLSEKQKTEILASLVMPTFAWLNTSSVAFWYELRPKAFNQMTLVIHTLLPKEIANSPGGGEIAEAVQATIEHIHLEDISVNEGPWKGLQSPLTAHESIGQRLIFVCLLIHAPPRSLVSMCRRSASYCSS
jgi:hypothetical protein